MTRRPRSRRWEFIIRKRPPVVAPSLPHLPPKRPALEVVAVVPGGGK